MPIRISLGLTYMVRAAIINVGALEFLRTSQLTCPFPKPIDRPSRQSGRSVSFLFGPDHRIRKRDALGITFGRSVAARKHQLYCVSSGADNILLCLSLEGNI